MSSVQAVWRLLLLRILLPVSIRKMFCWQTEACLYFPENIVTLPIPWKPVKTAALSVTPVEGEVRQDGNKVYIKQGSGLTVTAEPAEFYRLSSLTYQGQDQIENFVTGTANYPFESLEDGGTWIASFEKVKPSVVVNSTVRTGIYNDAPSAVAYAKFSGLHPSEYGMFLQRASGTGKELQLEAKGNADGQFAIRVFGEGVKTGSFTMQPYFIANEGDDPQRGDKTDSFSLEQ